MAEALADSCEASEINHAFYWRYGAPALGAQPDTLNAYAENAVIVHVGSGDDLSVATDWAKQYQVPLLQCSTYLMEDIYEFFQDGRSAIVVKAPIAHMGLLRLRKFAVQLQEAFEEDTKISLTKASLERRKDADSIGDEIGALLKISTSNTSVIKETALLKQFQIDPDQCEYVSILAEGQGLRIELSARTMGLEAYALGIIDIVKMISENKSEIGDGIHNLSDLIDRF